MATQRYGKANEALANGDLDWLNDTIKLVLISDADTYTPNFSTDEFLDDIPGAVQHTVSDALSGKSNTLGVLDATDLLIEAVTQASDEQIVAGVLFSDTEDPETSRLWAYIDNPSELPFTPNGSDVTWVWDDGSNKIMKI